MSTSCVSSPVSWHKLEEEEEEEEEGGGGGGGRGGGEGVGSRLDLIIL